MPVSDNSIIPVLCELRFLAVAFDLLATLFKEQQALGSRRAGALLAQYLQDLADLGQLAEQVLKLW